MYKLLLTLKYLRRKLAPMFAAVSVMLCTMMVIIVISVMGGFLDLLTSSMQRITGDVTIDAGGSLTGFPYYDELVSKLEQRPEIAAATPAIRTYSLIHIGDYTTPVQVYGIRPEELSKIIQYRDLLHWTTAQYIDTIAPPPKQRDAEARKRIADSKKRIGSLKQAGMNLQPPESWQRQDDGESPGTVLGIEVNPFHQRDSQGKYDIRNALLGHDVTLTFVPFTDKGGFADSPRRRSLVVVNEFKSGVFELDSNRVYVPFDWLQRQLDMEQVGPVWEQWDPQTGEPIGEPTVRPGRATEVMVGGRTTTPCSRLKPPPTRSWRKWCRSPSRHAVHARADLARATSQPAQCRGK